MLQDPLYRGICVVDAILHAANADAPTPSASSLCTAEAVPVAIRNSRCCTRISPGVSVLLHAVIPAISPGAIFPTPQRTSHTLSAALLRLLLEAWRGSRPYRSVSLLHYACFAIIASASPAMPDASLEESYSEMTHL